MVFALFNFTALMLISGIHIYWALGGKAGVKAAIPELKGNALFEPGIPGTMLVALLMAASAFYFLFKVQIFSADSLNRLPSWVDEFGAWILGAVFLIRAVGEFRYVGFFKKDKSSLFARLDSRYYSPLCMLLAFNSFMVAIYF